MKGTQKSLTTVVVETHGHPAPANPSLAGSRQEQHTSSPVLPTDTAHGTSSPSATQLWATPNVPNGGRTLAPGTSMTGVTLDGQKRQVGLENQAKAWPTRSVADSKRAGNYGRGNPTLAGHVKTWPTATVNSNNNRTGISAKSGDGLSTAVRATTPGRLNPRWVETLMGLPVGWTMPSCANPAILAPMNCDSSATESCPQPQPKHSQP